MSGAGAGDGNTGQQFQIQHIVSSTYSDLHPSGYIFAVLGPVIRLIYYHDEPRVVAEVVQPNGQSSFQTMPMRVQDVAITMPIEDFAKLAVSNLRNIEEMSPGTVSKYGINFGDVGGD